ncbi:MAG TPA: DNA primase [Porticoccaceae bacterium]|nr:DNA primase [Porticoccaceae bacterium]
MPGRIPQRFIDDLLDRIDIVDVIGARIDLRRTGKNHSARCPFHDEKTPSFSVSPDKQFFYCFGCGAGGNAIGFVMDYDRIDFPRAVETLAAMAGMTVPTENTGEDPRSRRRQVLYEILEKADDYYRNQLRQPTASKAVAYLRERGLSGEIARDYHIGYAPAGWDNLIQLVKQEEAEVQLLIEAGLAIHREDNQRIYDRFRDRIMFPIRDNRGRTIAFGGRVLGDDKPKYLNSPETLAFHKRRELYGLYEASRKSRNLDRLLVVEGYMDVLALAQFGIDNAVATLGTATTLEHLEKIFRYTSEVVFCFDGDEAGRKAALRAMETALPAMSDGRSAKFLFMPEGEDPDTLVREIGPEAFNRRLAEAKPLSTFLFEHAGTGLDLSLPDDLASFSQRAAPLINQLPEGVFQQLLLDQLAGKTGLAPDTLKQLLASAPLGTKESSTAPDTAPPPEYISEEDYNYEVHQADGQPWPPAPHPETDIPPLERAHLNEHASYQGKRVKLSPTHWLTGLLAHHPQLIHNINSEQIEQLKTLDTAGMDLLFEVVELIQKQPDMPLYILLGHWHGTHGAEAKGRLNNIVNSELITEIDPAQVSIEELFNDILESLLKDAQRNLPVEQLLNHLESQPSLSEANRKTAIELWQKLSAEGVENELIAQLKQILAKTNTTNS